MFGAAHVQKLLTHRFASWGQGHEDLSKAASEKKATAFGFWCKCWLACPFSSSELLFQIAAGVAASDLVQMCFLRGFSPPPNHYQSGTRGRHRLKCGCAIWQFIEMKLGISLHETTSDCY